MTTLAFCYGSDRYTALVEPEQCTVYDVLGQEVFRSIDAPSTPDPLTLVQWLRRATETVRPYRFEVGDPETLNADLRDPAWKSWDDPSRTPADRPVVKTVYPGRKDGFTAELSDGSVIAYPLSREDLADLRKA